MNVGDNDSFVFVNSTSLDSSVAGAAHVSLLVGIVALLPADRRADHWNPSGSEILRSRELEILLKTDFREAVRRFGEVIHRYRTYHFHGITSQICQLFP